MLLFYDYRLFFHHLLLLLLFINYNILPQRSYAVSVENTLIPSRVQDFHARYDHQTDSIYIQWSYPEDLQNQVKPQFLVRYRITNRPDDLYDYDWKYSQVGAELEAKLELDDIRNGDELQAQVRAGTSDGTMLEDWSQYLLISVSKRVVIDGISAEDDDLLPPLNFQAYILSPSMVRLEWTPPPLKVFPDVNHYYIVNVKQLTSTDRTPLLRQQVKVHANSFTLQNLKPGQRYELTVRTAASSDRISNVAAIVEITMPGEDQYFEVGNLIISSHFKTANQGTVNLTWEVPEKMESQIKSYDLHYSEAGTEDWHQLKFNGSHSSASLTTLKSDTEYLLKIQTHLANNLTTESGQFKFRTPAVIKNPIKKMDVIYMHETGSVRLQWTLENFLSANIVDGYDVYLSDDPNRPDSEWSYYRINGFKSSNDAATKLAMNSLALHDLKHDHVYYVRINVRKKDGEVLRSPTIYRFQTLEHREFYEHREGNTLSYRLLSPGRVQITWTYPSYILPFITGSSIMYAECNDFSTKNWERITLVDPRQNFVVLEQLKPNSRYLVHIVPQINNTFYNNNIINMFEIRTGSGKFLQPDDSHLKMMQQTENQQENAMKRWENEKLLLNACNPHSIKNECLGDERCIVISADHFHGFCIPRSLRDAIINN